MAVQSVSKNFGIDGHKKSVAQFRNAHHENATALLNLAEGKGTDDFRPPYDPEHDDNQWPRMVHHPAKGEKTVGRSLVGVQDPKERERIKRDNQKALDTHLSEEHGFRTEPYVKPQVRETTLQEQLALSKKREETMQTFMIDMLDRVTKVEQKQPVAPAVTPQEVKK